MMKRAFEFWLVQPQTRCVHGHAHCKPSTWLLSLSTTETAFLKNSSGTSSSQIPNSTSFFDDHLLKK